MPDNDGGVSKKLSTAKSALAGANKAFPSPKMASPTPAPKPAAPARPSGNESVGQALQSKAANIDAYASMYPKMHNGGPVPSDGVYQLKEGEHVLTEKEANMARKHAMLASGMKSLAKAPKKKMAAPKAAEKETEKSAEID